MTNTAQEKEITKIQNIIIQLMDQHSPGECLSIASSLLTTVISRQIGEDQAALAARQIRDVVRVAFGGKINPTITKRKI